MAAHDPIRPQAIYLVLHLVHQIGGDVVETDGDVAHGRDALQCPEHVTGGFAK